MGQQSLIIPNCKILIVIILKNCIVFLTDLSDYLIVKNSTNLFMQLIYSSPDIKINYKGYFEQQFLIHASREGPGPGPGQGKRPTQ